MLSKLTGVFAPRPRPGPHKLRECLPLLIIIRNRLKYALNAREAQMILRQGLVAVDGKPRKDSKYPAGFMDVVEIPKTGDRFRIMYDVKGRFSLVKISESEANIKMLKVENIYTTTGRIPVAVTHDGHRIRYPDPRAHRGDTLVYNVKDKKVVDLVKTGKGKVVLVTGGANRGRIGEIVSIERHPGAFDIARLKDATGHEFATRASNVFVVGKDMKSIPVTLPKQQGIRTNVIQEREEKLIAAEARKNAQTRAVRKVRKQVPTSSGKISGQAPVSSAMFLGFSSMSEVYVYVTCVLMGISLLMPIKAIMSAPAFLVDYYKYIAGDPDALPNVPFFWANILTFYNVISLVTQIIVAPTVLTRAVRSLSLNIRFLLSFILMMIELLVLVILPSGNVSQNVAIGVFAAVTILAGAGKAYLEGTAYALAGSLPPKFMTAVMFGCGSSGLISSVLQCVIKASMEHTYESILTQSHIYFSLGLTIMFISLCMTLSLRYSYFAREHVAEFRVLGRQCRVEEEAAQAAEAEGNIVEPFSRDSEKQSHPESTEDSTLAGAVDETNMTTSQQMLATSIMPVIRLIYPMQIACFCSFFLALFIFPSLIIPIDRRDRWFATIAILMYNCGDATGRLLTAIKRIWPSRRVVIIASLLRFLFIPFMFLCIFKQIPGHIAPYIIMFFVGLTNYIGALTMVYGPITPGLVTVGQKVVAGQLMGVALLGGASVASLVAILVVFFLP